MPYLNETVIAGNSTARIKNYYPDTGLVVLYDINGEISSGDVIQCQESGEIIVLGNFVINDDYDLNYEPTDDFGTFLSQEDGEIIAQEEYFTGLPSQDYQTRNILRP